MTSLEQFIQSLHNNFYFKEYTYSKTQFSPEGSPEIEIADNIIWLDDIFFILQLKQRELDPNDTTESVSKWFDNKVVGKGVKQIKNTLDYLKTYNNIKITNDRQHYFNIAEAPLADAKKIIVYNDGSGQLPEEKRNLKFYISSSAGYIHLFHAEDYMWICKYLLTPPEIKSYLTFREGLFKNNPDSLNYLPEQYVLGHYFEATKEDPLDANYINALKQLVDDTDTFDLSTLIQKFSDRLIFSLSENDYYIIQKEIAKLMRNELRHFKMRLQKSFDDVKDDKFSKPYRIYFPRTGCAFVFIPLQKYNSEHWKTALSNFTIAHKYEVKADKCIGVIVFKTDESEYIEAYWAYVYHPWEYDEELEKTLKENFPFRPVNFKEEPKYYLDRNK